jgi:hypothetical protein
MHNFEKDHREAAKASLERSPDEIEKFTRLPTVAHNWTRTISGAILALLLVAFAYAQEEIVKATHATIQHVDSTATSVIGLNPAIRDRVKSGHREWPKT